MERYRVRTKAHVLERRVYRQATWIDKILGREGGFKWEEILTAEKDYIKLILSNWGVEAEWEEK